MTMQSSVLTVIPRDFDIFAGLDVDKKSMAARAIVAPLQGAEIFSDVIQGRRAARLPLATFCRRFAAVEPATERHS